MITPKVTCDDTYSNKSQLIVGQGMLQLHEMWKYLNWELNVGPGILKEFEVMAREDFAVPGPYPTYVLQNISKLRRPPTLSSLSLIITQILFLPLVPNALGKSSVFKVTTNSTGMVDDSAAIVGANDNSLGLVMKRSRRWQIIRIWSRRFWSRRCPLPLSHLIFFYKGFCMRTIYSPTYVLTTYGLIVCLGCLLLDSFPPPFFFYIEFLIVVTLILLHTYSLQHSAVSDM